MTRVTPGIDFCQAAESVIRVLHDFKDEGLIEIESGKIRVVQPAKLEKVVRWNVAL